MPRKIVQDIIVNKKPARFSDEARTETKKLSKEESIESFFAKRNRVFDKKDNIEFVSKKSRIFLWSASILSVVILLFFLSAYFATAVITLTPKNEFVSINDTFSISSSEDAAGLHFEVFSAEKEISKSLEPEGEKQVERKATGKAIIYNNYNSAAQRLVNNTRLETKDGLVYRIRQSVTVPGIKTVNGVKTPGSIEVEIIADQAGDKYNMKVSDLKGDFTIPGFKGMEQYDYFYARLSADATGGFIGKAKTVSEDQIIVAREEVKKELQEELIKNIYDQQSDQYIIFKNNYFVTFEDLPDEADTDSFAIREKAVINAVVFKKDELSMFIAKNKIKDFDGSKVDALWTDNTLVSVSGKTARPWSEQTLKAIFYDDHLNIVWTYDVENILNSVVGENKSVLESVLADNEDSILEIEASIWPKWKNKFPEKTSKIKIFDSVRNEYIKP